MGFVCPLFQGFFLFHAGIVLYPAHVQFMGRRWITMYAWLIAWDFFFERMIEVKSVPMVVASEK